MGFDLIVILFLIWLYSFYYGHIVFNNCYIISLVWELNMDFMNWKPLKTLYFSCTRILVSSYNFLLFFINFPLGLFSIIVIFLIKYSVKRRIIIVNFKLWIFYFFINFYLFKNCITGFLLYFKTRIQLFLMLYWIAFANFSLNLILSLHGYLIVLKYNIENLKWKLGLWGRTLNL